MRLIRGKENDVVAVHRKERRASGLSQHPLAPVPVDGVPKPLGRDEGHPSREAVVARHDSHAQELVAQAAPLREDPLKIGPRLDGLLHGEPRP